MLRNMFALSEKGAKDLKAGIIATVISNICLMAPISVLMMVTMYLLEQAAGKCDKKLFQK